MSCSNNFDWDNLVRDSHEESLRIVIELDNGESNDISIYYKVLQSCYQQITESMLKLHKPLLDARVLFRSIFNIRQNENFINESQINKNEKGNSLKGLIVGQFPVVAIGGTFDRLHAGHKLMLSIASLLASKSIVCGITGIILCILLLDCIDESMCHDKKYSEKIQPWDIRATNLIDFLQDFNSKSTIQLVKLMDPFGPTITEPNIDAIVVSHETLQGAHSSIILFHNLM